MIATELKIRLYGDPCLRKKSVSVKDIGPGERMLIQSMIATMHYHKGIGLAAPQVGINQRIIVADVADGQGPIVVINPQIIKKSGSGILEEGCLSIPGITVHIKRSTQILIRYKDEFNKNVERIYNDLLARVILHETDHLDGKLIIDYASLVAKRKFQKQLQEIKKSRQKSKS